MATNTLYRRNIYSEELLKIIHIDQDLEYIKDVDAMSKMDTDQKESTNTVYDQRNGVRCIRISPDGKHLASGDRAGNIRIHELQFMDEICKIEAHDAEVLCLEYSEQVQVPSSRKTKSLLASASRDRLIHVFNSSRDYSFLNTLDDHSSSITAIRFLGSHNASQQNKSTEAPQHVPANIQMVSCGADKSIIFRDITLDHKGQPEFQRVNHIVGKTTLYDMEIDRDDQYILTACQDRNIRVYNVDTGKHSKTFKGSQSEDGTLIKVVLDQSGMYAATSCTDKTLAIYEYESGDIAATMFGHSELVTGLKFTNDCKHLVSVSGDGCIFIWRLPQTMTSNMLARMKLKSSNAYNNMSLMQTTNLQPDTDKLSNVGNIAVNAGNIAVSDEGIINQHKSNSLDPNANQLDSNLVPPDYAFNVGGLPVWAKKQMGGTSLDSQPKEFLNPLGSPNQVNLDGKHKASNLKSSTPKGKWAQRLATGAVSDVESKSETGIASDKGNSLEAQQNVNGNKQVKLCTLLVMNA
jgi:WD40 repeat protein